MYQRGIINIIIILLGLLFAAVLIGMFSAKTGNLERDSNMSIYKN